MTLIYTALLCEAQTIIEKEKLKKTNTNPKIYSNENLLVVIGGVGGENTINSLEYIFNNYTITKAINLGTAGCNNKDIEIGTLFCTNKKLDGIGSVPVETVDTPQLNTAHLTLNTLYDMEAKYFEDIVNKYLEKENIFIFKVVSDHLDKSNFSKEFAKQLVLKNYKRLKPFIP